MIDTVYVSLDISNNTRLAGVVRVTEKRDSITSVFSYDPNYLASPDSYPLDLFLPLVAGNQVITGGLPGALRDASPDRWGRNLIRKNLQAGDSGRTGRHIGELDYLLGVSDATRQGALRVSTEPAGPYVDNTSVVPPLIDLGRLRNAARKITVGDDIEGVKELLRAGTASLGGARPKAAVTDGDRLLLAKFSHATDDYDQVGAECVALDLAELAGIDTPWHDLLVLDDDRALVVERFDRRGSTRVGYISAMTLTGLIDGDTMDYLQIADGMRNDGSNTADDVHGLWRRMLFSLGINNLDDHGRNHGFLRDGAGWRLAPVFDLTPDPSGHQRATLMAGASHTNDCFAALPDIAASWDISSEHQRAIASDVVGALDQWSVRASARHVTGPAISQLGRITADHAARMRHIWPAI
jgi:serine/threonine-protein kinase HipA